MMTKAEVMRWLSTLAEDALVAIDDGGLTLVEVKADEKFRCFEETGAFLDVGGVPLEVNYDEEAGS